jgi:hypothetical protein
MVVLLRPVTGVLDDGICSGWGGDAMCFMTGDETVDAATERGAEAVTDPPCDRDEPLGLVARPETGREVGRDTGAENCAETVGAGKGKGSDIRVSTGTATVESVAAAGAPLVAMCSVEAMSVKSSIAYCGAVGKAAVHVAKDHCC